jgi:hypothetical protein
VEQRFSGALNAVPDVASAAEVPQRLKPSAQQRLYAGLEACSTLWQMIAPAGKFFQIDHYHSLKLIADGRVACAKR